MAESVIRSGSENSLLLVTLITGVLTNHQHTSNHHMTSNHQMTSSHHMNSKLSDNTMVSYVSHKLPGNSSMHITRHFTQQRKPNQHVTHSAQQTSHTAHEPTHSAHQPSHTAHQPSHTAHQSLHPAHHGINPANHGMHPDHQSSHPAHHGMHPSHHEDDHPRKVYQASFTGGHTYQGALSANPDMSAAAFHPGPSASPFHPDHQGLNGQTPGPFAPRFQVARWEVSDEEWQEELTEGFYVSGLIPDMLATTPQGLVNINYGLQACVHMGTSLAASTVGEAPSRVTYPAVQGRFYSLALVDAEMDKLHWLLVNIPGSRVSEGTMVTEYFPPTPGQGSGEHRYVMMALLQARPLGDHHVAKYRSGLCEEQNRAGFRLDSLMNEAGLEKVVAANYFKVNHSNYVDSVQAYCQRFRNK